MIILFILFERKIFIVSVVFCLIKIHSVVPEVVLLTVFRYAVFRFVLVEKTKSAKNIWEPIFENVIILGFIMADTSSKRQNVYIFY